MYSDKNKRYLKKRRKKIEKRRASLEREEQRREEQKIRDRERELKRREEQKQKEEEQRRRDAEAKKREEWKRRDQEARRKKELEAQRREEAIRRRELEEKRRRELEEKKREAEQKQKDQETKKIADLKRREQMLKTRRVTLPESSVTSAPATQKKPVQKQVSQKKPVRSEKRPVQQKEASPGGKKPVQRKEIAPNGKKPIQHKEPAPNGKKPIQRKEVPATRKESVSGSQPSVRNVKPKSPAHSTPSVKTSSGKRKSSKKSQKDREGFVKEILQWCATIAAAFVIALIADTFLIVNAQIPSGSMENTIMPGDRVIGNRLSYLISDPERFDIVIFEYPDDPSQLFIKRIIGLPGETIEIRGGHIYINGSYEPLEDVDTKEVTNGSFGPYTVPDDCYFVMGDNRNNSKDSRYWVNTYVSEDAILGKAVFRYWPLNEMGSVK